MENISCDGSYVLDNDIVPAAVTQISQLCSAGKPFMGTFDGQNHTIANLTIPIVSGAASSLFGKIDAIGTISNLNLNNITVTSVSPGGVGSIGILAGVNDGTIENVAATNSQITDPQEEIDNNTGGLVGVNSGTIRDSYAKVTVTTHGRYFSGNECIGGFVGTNSGTIENSASLGNVNISAYQSDSIGGFVGKNTGVGTITNCFSQGAVSVDSASSVGGFAGVNNNDAGAAINHVYSIGRVSVSGSPYSNIGGLVGTVDSPPGGITDSFWNTDTAQQSKGVGNLASDPAGVNGATTAQMQQRSTYTAKSWDINAADINAIWDIVDGHTYPFFKNQRVLIAGCIKATDNEINDPGKVKLAVNGSVAPDDEEIFSAGDCYVFALHPAELVAGNSILLFLTDSGFQGNAIYVANNDTTDINDVNILTNRVYIYSKSPIENATIRNAKGGLTDNILFDICSSGQIKFNVPQLDLDTTDNVNLGGLIGSATDRRTIASLTYLKNWPIPSGKLQMMNSIDLSTVSHPSTP